MAPKPNNQRNPADERSGRSALPKLWTLFSARDRLIFVGLVAMMLGGTVLETILIGAMGLLLVIILMMVEPLAPLVTLLAFSVAGGDAVWRITGRSKAYGTGPNTTAQMGIRPIVQQRA